MVYIGTIFVTVLVMVAGCGFKTTNGGLSPEELGRIGAMIDENPNQMKDILGRFNLTEDKFRRAVREVSENPELARRYHQAFRKAKEQPK